MHILAGPVCHSYVGNFSSSSILGNNPVQGYLVPMSLHSKFIYGFNNNLRDSLEGSFGLSGKDLI